ncbi:MAG: hypothetical protein ABIR17_09055 [Pseudolysinimonas sp.]|uniref:hypothetical protein n=1 Tax=Pseudolysinimonas sp. TaxID=2680009 RepID=UPI00326434FB
MDDIERLIREANAAPVRRTSSLSPRAEADLAAILSASPPIPAHRDLRWRRRLIWGSAVAAAIAVILTVTMPFATPPAVASPPLLTFIPVSGSPSTVLGRLGEVARSSILTPTSSVIASETWSADLTEVAGTTTTFVQPREVTRTYHPDGSASIVTLAGSVRWGTVPNETAAPQPGTVLERLDFTAAESPRLFLTPPPSSSGEDLRAYLGGIFGFTEATTTGEYFGAVENLRNEWELDGAQTAALTEMLASLPDVSILGEVMDRLGRPAIAVATSTRAHGTFEDVLLFDKESGALLASEEIYLGGDPDISLASPSVFNYVAWKAQP